MDTYLDYLKARIDAKARKGSVAEWHAAKAEFNRALDFARRNDLTDRYLAPEVLLKSRLREREVARELWLEQNRDGISSAETAWAEMTAPDSWSPEALALLEEARTLIAQEAR